MLIKLKEKFKLSRALKRPRWRYAIFGVLLSIIAPLGEWIFVKVFSQYSSDSFFLTLIYTELAALISFSLFGYVLGNQAEHLERLAYQDKLTGLYNRHYLMARLNELVALNNRYQEKFSLIMLDLDHFKKVNDSYGHSVGDQTLKAVASCINAEIREADYGSRYGGEEFIIVCPNTSVNYCYMLAERVRIAIERLESKSLGFPGPQTISAGVYEYNSNQDESLSILLDRLDQALYIAKREGRNKVVIYDENLIEK